MVCKVILTCSVTGENQYSRLRPNFSVASLQVVDATLKAEHTGVSVCVKSGKSRDYPNLFLDEATPDEVLKTIGVKKR